MKNELSELIDNLDFRSKNHHFILIHRALVFPGSDITLRAVLAKTALRVTLKVGPASGKHLGSKKRPKTAGDRFSEEFWQFSDFHENRHFSCSPGTPVQQDSAGYGEAREMPLGMNLSTISLDWLSGSS